MKLVFLDRATISPAVRFDYTQISAAQIPDIEISEHDFTRSDELVDRASGADILITNKVALNAATLTALPGLRFVACTATGVDKIDLVTARARGVGVANVRDYCTESVAEHVFALMLAARRGLVAHVQAVREGSWSRTANFCLHLGQHGGQIGELNNATLGIVGAGVLGQAVARRALAFGMRVLVAEHKRAPAMRPGRVAFEQVLAQSDVISLHAPLIPDTQGLMGAAEFARMKPTAVFINTARGGLVDEVALLAALSQGRPGFACLDVLSEEPPPASHLLLGAAVPNLLITPHVAWASLTAQQRVADETIRNVLAFLGGERRNRVD